MPSSACQRARYVAALSVDESPSQLDARALARHLERCADCRAFAETVSGFTQQVREADLHVIELRVSPGPPRRLRLIPRSIPAAVIATAAVLGGVAFAVASHEALKPQQQLPRSLPALVIDVSDADTSRESQRFLRDVRDASLARIVGAPRRGERERPGIKVG